MKSNSKYLIILASVAVCLAATGCNDENEDAKKGIKISSLCGNKHLDTAEACDGTLFAQTISVNCEAGTHFDASLLKCTDKCELDSSAACIADVCGDGLVSGNEECEAGVSFTNNMRFACDNPDKSKIVCENCKLVDNGACQGIVTTEGCGNGVLEDGEICDGGVFQDGVRKCPGELEELEDPIYRCAPSCTAVDTSAACQAALCGNGKINSGEVCDGTLFDSAEVAKIQCGSGKMLLEPALECADDCESIDASKACISDIYVEFSEVVPALKEITHKNQTYMYLNGLALELANMGKTESSLDSCSILMTNAAATSQKSWELKSLNIPTLGVRENVVICIEPKSANAYGSACNYTIDVEELSLDENNPSKEALANIFSNKDLMILQCGDLYVDMVNLNSVSQAINQGGIDFTRYCDSLPVSDPSKALLGGEWQIDPESEAAPAYGLGSHCESGDAYVASCKYTVDRTEFTARDQAMNGVLEVKIPGISDQTNKTDASASVKVQFGTGKFSSTGALSDTPQIHHMPTASVDSEWTNEHGIDRYLAYQPNWDEDQGFWMTEQGEYTLDAGISLDNGKTWTYCGPNGIIADYGKYVEGERNLLTVKYEDSVCGDGIISGGELCDGTMSGSTCVNCSFIDPVMKCSKADYYPINMDLAKCYSCDSGTVKAACDYLPATCRNNQLDEGELCDGNLFDHEAIALKCPADKKYLSEYTKCANNCVPDYSASCIPATCQNNQIDTNEACDGSLFNDELLAAKCKKDERYIAGRASCDYACNATLKGACVSKDYNLIFDEYIAKTNGDHKAFAFIIQNNGADVNAQECTLSILNSNKKIIGANYFSLGEQILKNAEAKIKGCDPIVICSEPTWDTAYTTAFSAEFNSNTCDATVAIGLYNSDYTLVSQDAILDHSDAKYLQLTCSGNYLDFIDLDAVRAQLASGKTHGKVGADKEPWGNIVPQLETRMVLDNNVDLTSFGVSTCVEETTTNNE